MDYLYSLQVIRESIPSFFTYFFVFISDVILRGCVVLLAMIYWTYDKKCGRLALVSYSTSYSINQFVKNIACVPRPWVLDSRLHVARFAEGSATGYSFPSGHSVTAASLLGQVAMSKRNKKIIIFFSYLLIILTAFSRNYLGCHTLKDVLVAILIAAVVLCAVNFIDWKVSSKESSKLKTVLYFLGIIVSVASTIFLVLKNYPPYLDTNGNEVESVYSMITDCYTACGVQIGCLLGLFLEEKFLNFELPKEKKSKIIIALLGAFGIGVLYLGLSLALKFLGDHVSHFVKYLIIFFFVTFLYPFAFTKFLDAKRK